MRSLVRNCSSQVLAKITKKLSVKNEELMCGGDKPDIVGW